MHDFCLGNMIDDYVPGEYTEEQGKAVATLMHAIGVGLDMMYSPNMSGAYSFSVARAIIENLGYDRGAQYLMRDYFTDRDWNDIVYAELAAGRPVVYCVLVRRAVMLLSATGIPITDFSISTGAGVECLTDTICFPR